MTREDLKRIDETIENLATVRVGQVVNVSRALTDLRRARATIERLQRTISDANGALFELALSDVEHVIHYHKESVPDTLRRVDRSVQRAIEILQVEIVEMVGG